MKRPKQDHLKAAVERVIRAVRRDGDRALATFARRFDGVLLPAGRFAVPKVTWKAAFNRLPVERRQALDACARRIRAFHWEERKRTPQSWTVSKGGVRLGQLIKPVDAVGVYVPGGRFSYPSTLLMAAIPARLAGVERVVALTPPNRLGDDVLAAAHLSGIDALFRVGGPAAIAALAIGTRSIPRVDMIVGPGNAMVTEAKRQLFGEVGIDLLAGPS